MATIGYSAKLKIGSAFLDECVMIGLPTLEVADVESTDLTVLNRTRTYVPGLQDGGSFSFECHYTADNYTLLTNLLGDVTTFKIFSPDDEDQTMSFSGYIKKGPDGNFEPNAIAKLKCEVKVTGAIVVGSYSGAASLAMGDYSDEELAEHEKAMKGWRE